MRKILKLGIIMLLGINYAIAATPVKKVLISQVVDHPALNMTTQGIIEGLEAAGYKRGINLEIRVESAQANAALASQIANKFVTQNPDVVVGVGTMTAQSFIKHAQADRVKLVFSSVTDPVAANLITALDQPSGNITGVSNFVQLDPQLKLFTEIQPNLKTLGIIYNPGEINSVTIVQKLKAISPKYNLKIVTQAVAKTADVAQAAVKLAAVVDAIFISNDNTALGSLQSIVRAATQKQIPIYVSDTDAIELGAVAALGPNQREIGLQTGKMVAKILDGQAMHTLAVELPAKTDLVFNLEAAKLANLNIPNTKLAQAQNIIQSSKS